MTLVETEVETETETEEIVMDETGLIDTIQIEELGGTTEKFTMMIDTTIGDDELRLMFNGSPMAKKRHSVLDFVIPKVVEFCLYCNIAG